MVAGLVGVPGSIGICQGGESAMFCFQACDDSFGNPCVPHSSIHLLVRFVTVSKAGLAVNALMVTTFDQQVAKGTLPLQITTMKIASISEPEFSPERLLR